MSGSSTRGFQALVTLGKNSAMRQGKETVLSKCGSIPAMSEHALPRRKDITKEPRTCLQFWVWVVFVVLRLSLVYPRLTSNSQ